jgi:hypothetical protein
MGAGMRADMAASADDILQMHIRYLLSTGKTEYDTMKRYIDEQAR